MTDTANPWTPAELAAFDKFEELTLLLRHEGKDDLRVPVWVVVVDHQVCVRAYNGIHSGWFKRAIAEPNQRVDVGGVERAVTFERTTGTHVPEVDAAYREKYARHGSSSLTPMEAEAALGATMRIVKRSAAVTE